MVSLGTIVLILSIVLCIHALSGRGLIGCQAGTSCNQVLGSRWSFLLGTVPVSALAMGAYIALLFCLLSFDRLEPDMQRFTGRIMLVIGGAVFGSAIWFIRLQRTLIHAFCPYCMTAHILGMILAVLIIFWCARRDISGRALHFLIGLLLSVALAVLQLCTTPKTLSERGFAQEELPQFDTDELPVIGKSDAPTAVTLLFDWQCSHCRRIHLMLPDVVRELHDSVAFICCPVSLSNECNPYVPYSADQFAGSCELMRMGLALWRTDRDAFREYERWFFGRDLPTVGEARNKAQNLIGGEALEKAMQDPWIDSYTMKALELFGRTSVNGKAAIPRFICEGAWLVPDADDAPSLAALIRSFAQ